MSTVRKAKPRAYRVFLLIPIIAFGLLAILGTSGNSSNSGSGNVPPIASDGCANTPLNTALNGDLQSNVTDPDSPVLDFTLLSQGVKGVATVDATGLFTYTPNAGSRGADSFFYQVDDLEGGSDTATMTVIIGNTRIMPLGDSITTGTGELLLPNRVGYRKKLFEDLVAAGFAVDFVGGATEPNPASFDSNHEGHPGFRDDQIATQVFAYLTNSPADIVLLHIGTNDVSAHSDTDPDDVQTILNQIDSWETSNNNPITVLLARIIDFMTPSALVTTFNNNVEVMALARPDDIIMVNQQTALVYPGDMHDDLHPKQVGYEKMADRWFGALTTSGVIPKCP